MFFILFRCVCAAMQRLCNGRVSVCPSVRLSVPSIDNGSNVQLLQLGCGRQRYLLPAPERSRKQPASCCDPTDEVQRMLVSNGTYVNIDTEFSFLLPRAKDKVPLLYPPLHLEGGPKYS